jgi:hypothetical protein
MANPENQQSIGKVKEIIGSNIDQQNLLNKINEVSLEDRAHLWSIIHGSNTESNENADF